MLNGTPYLLLNEFFEKYVFANLFKQKPVNSLTEVFPADPVIAMLFAFKDFLKVELILLKKFNVFFLNIIFEFLDLFIGFPQKEYDLEALVS